MREGVAYRRVNLDSEKLGFPAFGVYKLIYRRLLLLEEDTESTRDTLDTEKIVSGVSFSMGEEMKRGRGGRYLLAGTSIFNC